MGGDLIESLPSGISSELNSKEQKILDWMYPNPEKRQGGGDTTTTTTTSTESGSGSSGSSSPSTNSNNESSSIQKEVYTVGVIWVLFVVFGLSCTDSLLSAILPMVTNSFILRLLVKSILFTIVLWMILNFAFA